MKLILNSSISDLNMYFSQCTFLEHFILYYTRNPATFIQNIVFLHILDVLYMFTILFSSDFYYCYTYIYIYKTTYINTELGLFILFFTKTVYTNSSSINPPAQPTLWHYELSLAPLVVSRASRIAASQPIARELTFVAARAPQRCDTHFPKLNWTGQIARTHTRNVFFLSKRCRVESTAAATAATAAAG